MTTSVIEPNALLDGTFARATTGTYYDAAGVLQTAAINVPRLNYDPASLTTAPQLLVEAAGKNELPSSTGFVANWLNNGTTGYADNFGVAPDGTTTTTRALVGGTRFKSITAPANSQFCYSIFLKKTVGGIFLMYADGAGLISSGAGGFRVNLETLQITNVTVNAVAYGIQDVGSFVRVFCVFATSATGGVAAAHIYPFTGSTPVEVWQADVEFGVLKPSSPIKTTGAAVTRAADIVSATGLIYSSAAENDFPVWVANTPQIVGDKVIRTSTHRIYQRLIAGTTATAPELDAINWLDIAPTNRWAMFDKVVGTLTSTTGNLTVVMRPGAVSGLALLEMVGKKLTVVMKDAPGGKVVYSKTVSLDATLITSVYDWFYKPYEQLRDVVMLDLPSQFVSNELTITISGTGTVGVGVCKFGELTNIGQAQYGARVGITSFSKKGFDAFGNALITKRGFSKTVDLSIITEAGRFGAIFRKLASLDAVECIYIGSETAGLEPLIAYGFFKDFGIVVDYPTQHLCNLTIETLV